MLLCNVEEEDAVDDDNAKDEEELGSTFCVQFRRFEEPAEHVYHLNRHKATKEL